jgi:hypothetical protein
MFIIVVALIGWPVGFRSLVHIIVVALVGPSVSFRNTGLLSLSRPGKTYPTWYCCARQRPRWIHRFAVVANTEQSSQLETKQLRQLHLPLRVPWTIQVQNDLESAIKEIVDASPAVYVNATLDTTAHCSKPFVTSLVDNSVHEWRWSCAMPAFGVDCRLQLEKSPIDTSGTSGTTDTKSLILSLQGSTARAADWSWICSQFYRTTGSKSNTASAFNRIVSTREIRETLVEHHNRQPADPGIKASVAAWSPDQSPSFVQALLGSHPNDSLETSDKMAKLWQSLQTCGHVVIDPSPPQLSPLLNGDSPDTCFALCTTAAQQNALASLLQETTGQGPLVRTDRVRFLDGAQAKACNVATHDAFLRGLAHYFNTHLQHLSLVQPAESELPDDNSEVANAVLPASSQSPYTIPQYLQFAEYGPGDFYVVRLKTLSRTCSTFPHTRTLTFCLTG